MAVNTTSARDMVNWSAARSNGDRLGSRPNITNTALSHGGSNVRYFSSIDADIYFGDQYIDEITNIQWQVQQNAMPIFGYNSYTFDAIATGSRMISGQFVINFTQANYLETVLNVLTRVSRTSYGIDNKATADVFKDADNIRRHTPLWDSGFDIVVGYGGKKSETEYEQHLTLECCQLTGCTQGLDISGEPIQEVYSFIARDMRYDTSSIAKDEQSDVSNDYELEKTETYLRISDGEISTKTGTAKINIPFELSSNYVMKQCWLRFFDINLLKVGHLIETLDNSFSYEYGAPETSAIVEHVAEMEARKLYVSMEIYYEAVGSEGQQDNELHETVNVALLIQE